MGALPLPKTFSILQERQQHCTPAHHDGETLGTAHREVTSGETPSNEAMETEIVQINAYVQEKE